MTKIGTALALFGLSVWMWSIPARVAQLAPPTVQLGTVVDSGSYYLYQYSVANPTTSDAGIAALVFDVSASTGTPDPLAATGSFYDFSSLAAATSPETPRAPVGPITPGTWTAVLRRTAEIFWFAPDSGPFDADSIAPGDTLSGFGLRSPYLPEIGEVYSIPTWQSCCSVADSFGVYPLADTLGALGPAVLPRYAADEVTIDVIQAQVSAICDTPLWLDSAPLCAEFADLLDMAEADENDANFYGVAAVLDHFLTRVDDAQASMDANAYWLLTLNVSEARDAALTTALSLADLWHMQSVPNEDVDPDGFALADSIQGTGSTSGSVPSSSSQTLYFVKHVESSGAFVGGNWSVQLELTDVTADNSELVLRDVTVQRHRPNGQLRESMYLQQGTVMSIPAGDTRVSVTGNLTGWGSGGGNDLLAVTFTLENQGAGSEDFAIQVGALSAVWGGSWVSQPNPK